MLVARLGAPLPAGREHPGLDSLLPPRLVGGGHRAHGHQEAERRAIRQGRAVQVLRCDQGTNAGARPPWSASVGGARDPPEPTRTLTAACSTVGTRSATPAGADARSTAKLCRRNGTRVRLKRSSAPNPCRAHLRARGVLEVDRRHGHVVRLRAGVARQAVQRLDDLRVCPSTVAAANH